MARILPLAVVVALLAGTAAAFAVTERLKLVRSPIFDTRIENKLFSPVCGCESDEAAVSFRLREADTVSVLIVDGDLDVVRTLVDDRSMPAGPVRVAWDGRDEAGRVVVEGSYRPRVHLDRDRRTILMPNPITVDTTPPEVLSFRVEPAEFSPDGDGRNEKVSAFYGVDEPAHALLFVDGERRVRSRSQRLEGKLDWFGRVDGKPLRAGPVFLTLAAEDQAGNVSERTSARVARIEYVSLGRRVYRVPATVRFGVAVESDAATLRWRFAGATGTTRPGPLVLRAPQRPGRYTLFVEANGHGTRATVIVEARAG